MSAGAGGTRRGGRDVAVGRAQRHGRGGRDGDRPPTPAEPDDRPLTPGEPDDRPLTPTELGDRPLTRAEAEAALRAEGLQPRAWANAPGDTYGWHAHPYHKVLYCVRGSVVFHLQRGDVTLRPGDRLELSPGTAHAATVGPEGVECVEGAR